MHDYERAKTISNPFYSNCMIEAIKAKLRNWGNVKIYRVPSKYNNFNGSHFYWKETVNGKDSYYEFKHSENIKTRILFKGVIRKFEKEYMNAWRNLGLQGIAKKIAKKFEFDIWEVQYHRMSNDTNPAPMGLFEDTIINGKRIVGTIEEQDGSIFTRLFNLDENDKIINPKNENIIAFRPFIEEIDYGLLPETYKRESFKVKW